MVHAGARRAWTPLVSVGLSNRGVGSALPRTWVAVFSATGDLFQGIAIVLGHSPPLCKAFVERPLRGNCYSLQEDWPHMNM